MFASQRESNRKKYHRETDPLDKRQGQRDRDDTRWRHGAKGKTAEIDKYLQGARDLRQSECRGASQRVSE